MKQWSYFLYLEAWSQTGLEFTSSLGWPGAHGSPPVSVTQVLGFTDPTKVEYFYMFLCFSLSILLLLHLAILTKQFIIPCYHGQEILSVITLLNLTMDAVVHMTR